jgi:4-amino-4-deoxy-L-arabinose transferase-like glycosyltransferase
MDSSVSLSPENDRRVWRIAGFLLVLSAVLMLFFRGLTDPDEGRYSEIPREMVNSGNWLEMRLLNYRYYEKPPLTYWLVAASLKTLGKHDWAARVPLLPAALAVFAMALALARRRWDGAAGRTAGFVAITSVGLFAGMTFLLTDAFLTLWLTSACFVLYDTFQPEPPAGGRGARLLLLAILAFLGTLTKGFVAVVLPGAIVFLWLLWERRLRLLVHGGVLLAAVVYSALTAAVLVLIEKHNPGFFESFVIREHFGRFVGGVTTTQIHPQPFWYYAIALPLLLLPWFPFAFRAVRVMRCSRALSSDALSRFLLVWAGVIVVFFSISSGKLMSYVVPALVPIGLLVGRWGVAEPLHSDSRADRTLWRIGAGFVPFLGVVLVALWAVSCSGVLGEKTAKATLISVLPMLPLAAVAAAAFRRQRRQAPAWLALVTASFLFALAGLLTPLAGRDLNVQMAENSSAAFRQLAARLQPEDQVILFHRYRPSLAFYANRPIWLYKIENELLSGMSMERDHLGYLPNRLALDIALAGTRGRWYAVARRKRWEEFLATGVTVVPGVVAEDIDIRIVEIERTALTNAPGL